MQPDGQPRWHLDMAAIPFGHLGNNPRILFRNHRLEEFSGSDGKSDYKTLAPAYNIVPIFTHDLIRSFGLEK
jgi:hypothetical protein